MKYMNVKTSEELVKALTEKSRKLDKEKLAEVLDFVDFLSAKNEEEILKNGIGVLASKSKSFNFLVREPDIYSIKDVQ